MSHEVDSAYRDRIAVLVVDPRALLREGLQFLVEESAEFICLDSVADFSDVADIARHLNPDVAIISFDDDHDAAFEAVTDLKRVASATRIVLVTGLVRDEDVRRALDMEVAGMVDKSGGFDEICRAIRLVHAGESHYSAKVLERIDPAEVDFKPHKLAKTRLDLLSPRERNLLRVLALGKSLREACEELRISYKTADKQKASLMKKLSIHDRVTLARFAIREGIIDA